MTNEQRKKLEYLQALEAKKAYLQKGLPHLYGFKWYKWAWEFFNSTNRNCYICGGNQTSKSSSQIRKIIHWATEPSLWDKLWPTKPKQFWYLYPDLNVATVEWDEKWVKEFMPTGEFKTSEQYGWNAVKENRKIHRVIFNSGVTLYFKAYSLDSQALQTSTVHAIFCDEELPWHLYDELSKRRSAASVRGHFAMCFTATLAQEFWRLVIEEKGKYEKFPNAAKWQVSLYDCMKYIDGTNGPWTDELIKEEIAACSSEAEVKKRVFGRFVKDDNKMFPEFSRSKNLKPDHFLPKGWLIYAAVDCGGGGESHPAAIVFIAVNPDFTEARVFKSWIGGKEDTSAGDVLRQFQILRGNMKPVLQIYDWESKDFKLVSQRLGESFVPAEKSRDLGISLVNTLFKNEMLALYENPENMKIVNEFENLRKDAKKSTANDNGSDCVRYISCAIPWDFSKIKLAEEKKDDKEKDKKEDRREYYEKSENLDGLDLLEAELDDINEDYEYLSYGN